MSELALKQATIEYQQFGPQDSAHPPVLFVHGILVDGRLWRDVAEKLARRGYRWGPGGRVGFELGTRVATATASRSRYD